jgi:hypothetical protein
MKNLGHGNKVAFMIVLGSKHCGYVQRRTELLLALASTVILGSDSQGTHGNILLSNLSYLKCALTD